MPRKIQKRRTVSYKADVYQRLKNLSRRTGEPIAAIVERLAVAECDRQGEPVPQRIEHLERGHADRKRAMLDHGAYFTW